jgi:diguanylate cyclase (GGDEF)-like protein
MPSISVSEWRFSSRVLLPILVAGAATVLLILGILVYTTRESDTIARERQTELVSKILSEQIGKITRDQQSVTIWDEAIKHTKGDLDLTWFDLNLGVWMHNYFGHDRVYVLNAQNEPIYSMSDGKRLEASAYTSARTALTPLVQDLRQSLLARSADETEPDSLYAWNLVVIEARPAMASVVPILSDTGLLLQNPGTEALHASVRFLDGDFLDHLSRQYLLDKARFAWNEDTAWNEAAFPLARKSGAVLGYFVWQPDRPGWRLLTRTAPALTLGILVVAAIIAFLVQRLQRASKELEASEAQAQHLAFHDPLTGLPNRALFNDSLDRALADSRKSNSRVALLYLDLDRFKNVNDTLGHPAGDELIRELGLRLTRLVRERDCVARLSGDEFAIIQTDAAENVDVTALCQRLIETVAQPFRLLGSSAFVGVSIGIARTPEDGVDRAELLRKADIALYCAKINGRNQFRIFSEEMDFSIQRRREIEGELRDAIASGDQLCLNFQPQYGNDAESLVGVEALLRWNHPKHGTIAPGVFIPIAEESGLIAPLWDWVLRQACAAGARWPTIPRIAVNVSPVQFRAPGFAPALLRVLEETGMQPRRLELEITESVLLESTASAATTFPTLRNAGVRIVLDDFGTGYSSLSYLQKFSVDKIKIDRSFIRNLDSTGSSDAIIRAMVELARAMGIEVTAEGIETVEQRDYLQSIGCNELQGFLLSRPGTTHQIDRMLETKRTEAAAAAVAA